MLHRDIKPDNFLIGSSKHQNLIYLIDFGLAKRFRDIKTGDHIPYKEGKDLTGTVRYASLNTHLGIEQSRRDDLEALGFILLYFLRGSLPWQGLHAKNKEEKYNAIKEKKKATTIELLCQDQPVEFASYLKACRKLGFDEKPDYGMLRKLFRDLFNTKGFEYDYIYDWLIQRQSTFRSLETRPDLESNLDQYIEEEEEKKEEVKRKEVEEAKEVIKKPEIKKVQSKKVPARGTGTALAPKPKPKIAANNIKGGIPAPKIVTTNPKVINFSF